MSYPYANKIAVDKGGIPMQEFPAPVLALQRYTDEAANVSSVITLTDRTVQLEVTAVGSTGFLKWIPTSDTEASVVGGVSGANYDHVIPAGRLRRFVVPPETIGTSSISGANIANGLYRRVAYITGGAGSILATEY